MSEDTTWRGRARIEGKLCEFTVQTGGEVPGPEHQVQLEGGGRASVAELELVAPVAASKIFGVGRNFRAHAAEMGNEVPQAPLVFFKPPSALIPSGCAIELPSGYERIDMEAELVVVIGREAKGVAPAQALDFVGGFCLGNDVSNRDLQKRDKQWTRAKGFDTFAPVSAFVREVRHGSELPDTAEVVGLLDDTEIQRAPVSDMVFTIAALIAHLSDAMTLVPGDLIFTGTPAGVASLHPGSRCQVRMDGYELAPVVSPVVRRGPLAQRE